jgi:lipoprotein NlpI
MLGFALVPLALSAADAAKAKQLLSQAQAAYSAGKPDEALKFATDAVTADPQNAEALYVRARLHEARNDHAKAVADYSEVIKLTPDAAGLYQRRGTEHFKLGNIKESIADFDKFISLAPGQEPHHWQRGISYYYAGRFEEGRKQFESHQTVNQNDVENAVWHFLCIARKDGVDKARAALIKIESDRRVPMMQIYALYAGKGTVSDVMDAVRAGNPGAGELNFRQFYANLYLGLYYEVTGEAKAAKEHITKAAKDYKLDHYMWDVARVHADRLASKTE